MERQEAPREPCGRLP